MIKHLIKSIIKFSSYNSHTNVYGFARSFFAFSTLLTLLINPNNVLFPSAGDGSSINIANTSMLREMNLFIIFSDNLFIANIIAIVILITVLIGIFPRYTVVFHWWVSSSFLLASPAVEGGDQLIAIITLLFIPIGLLDKRKWHWSSADSEVKSSRKVLVINSFYVAIRVQIFILYLQAAIGKLSVDEWVNGTVLYYWFEDNIFGLNSTLKPIILPLLSNYIFVSILTYSVLIFEIALALALVMNKEKRKIFLFLGILFHFAIWIIHGLPTFFITMIGALIIYIIPFYEQINTQKIKYLFSNYKKISKTNH